MQIFNIVIPSFNGFVAKNISAMQVLDINKLQYNLSLNEWIGICVLSSLYI